MAANHKIRSILPGTLHDAADAVPVGALRGRAAPLSGRVERARQTAALIEEDVTESVRTVERAVENLAALQENCDYFKSIADELRDELDLEKTEIKSAVRLLAELEHDARVERERALRAEENAAACDVAVMNLQREIEAIRTQMQRLVGVVSHLVPADRVSDLHDAFDRLVA